MLVLDNRLLFSKNFTYFSLNKFYQIKFSKLLIFLKERKFQAGFVLGEIRSISAFILRINTELILIGLLPLYAS